jgi:undecaprenyl diphosphate synthase
MNLKLDHLAMILDGNRRWGRARGLKMNVDFYMQSGLLGLEIAEAVFDQGIPNLTIWIGSVANLTERPKLEIRALNKAYKQFFSDAGNKQFAHERKIMIDCIGRWRELLDTDTVAAIESTMTETAQYADSGKRLTVLIGYDGVDERGATLRRILTRIGAVHMASGERSHDFFGKELPQLLGSSDQDLARILRDNSWTGHLPDVDLLIRTGSGDDPHNSAGFLSLITDHTQYSFTSTLWPDFTPDELNQILADFAARERRHGK